MSRLMAWMFFACLSAHASVSPAAEPGGALETAALAEMNTLSQALETVAIFHNFYIGIENLNDVDNPGANNPFDDINQNGGPFALRPERGLFDSTRTLFDGTPQWEGPFVSFPGDRIQLAPGPYDVGCRLDPWLSPYYFFSPHGLVRGDAGVITQELYGDAFDRYAIVSLGADAVMSGDDLIWLFGSGVTTLGLSSISGNSVAMDHSPGGTVFAAEAGSEITLRGYRFGATQDASKVFFGATELTNISDWSATQVTLTLPFALGGSANLYLEVGGLDSNSLALTVVPPPVNSVRAWAHYQ